MRSRYAPNGVDKLLPDPATCWYIYGQPAPADEVLCRLVPQA
jgi:hypothetical protein